MGHHHKHETRLGPLWAVVAMLIIGIYFVVFGWPAYVLGRWFISPRVVKRQTLYFAMPCFLLLVATYPFIAWWVGSDLTDAIDEGQWFFVIGGHIVGLCWGLTKPLAPVVEYLTQKQGWKEVERLRKLNPGPPPPPRPWGTMTKEQEQERAREALAQQWENRPVPPLNQRRNRP